MFKISNKLIAVFVIGFIIFQSYSITLNVINGFKMKKQKEEQIFLGYDITAKATANGNVEIGISSLCTIDLVQGWNLISICADSENKSIDDLLDDIEGDYSFIMQWNNSNQEFVVYSAASSSKPFTELNENLSYFIYYNPVQGDVGISGDEFNNKNISMGYQWDTPTYPYVFTGNVSKYLNKIDDQYQFMMKWNESNQEFVVLSASSSTKPFDRIHIGEGQFIYVTNISGTVLRYNKSDLEI